MTVETYNPNNPCDDCGAMSNASHLEECSNKPSRKDCMSNHPSNTTIKKEDTMLETIRYAKKPFYVNAVQVTEQNIEAVSVWCGGEILTLEGPGDVVYIKVPVENPLNEKQTHALVGSWILEATTGFKMYGNKAFLKNFEPTGDPNTLILGELKRGTPGTIFISNPETNTVPIEVAVAASTAPVAVEEVVVEVATQTNENDKTGPKGSPAPVPGPKGANGPTGPSTNS